MRIDELINYIKKRKLVTIPEVQRQFGLKYGETRQLFQKLQADDKIKYIAGLTFEWCAVDEERITFIKQRAKELEERRAKLRASAADDDDLDSLFDALTDDDEDDLDLDDDEDDDVDDAPGWKMPAAYSTRNNNGKRELVTLDEMLNSDEFKQSKGKLAFVVGKDSDGKNVVADLANLPHLLIAGTTGSGKSTVLNSLIVSLAKKYSPDYVKFLLIDTKFVEMSRYDGMPHMLVRKSIISCNDAFSALNYLTAEMERRYCLFRESGVGNIDEYNKQSQTQLPYIVCAIDEIADIMQSDKRLFEVRIMRLAQKCRASGIHLVLATQRPDVRTVTGTIKAAMPSRIALRVCSIVDSVVLFGNKGAEQLLGGGDMLFVDASYAEPRRIQGPFVSGVEIRDAVNEFKKKYVCKFDKDVENRIFSSMKDSTATVAPTDNSQTDPLCRRALRFWLEKQGGRASIASIQRNLGIGFNRAGRIMDYCQKMGYVEQLGPNDSSIKPVMVLVTLDDLPRLFPDQED